MKERGEMAKGGAPYHKPTPYTVEGVGPEAATLRDLKISERQSHDWQKMAVIPDDGFEAALAVAGPRPTTAGVIAAHTEPRQPPVDSRALWLWGRLLDFERDGVLDWRLLEDAVDAKIGKQLALVEWWDEQVRNGRPKTNRDRALISRSDAEDRSGFSQQQLSRWRKALADADKYREQQILAAIRKADLAPRGQGKAGAAAW